MIAAMKTTAARSPDEMARRILRRLFLLRNFTILGAGLAIGIANSAFNLALPLRALFTILALLTLLNVFTLVRCRFGRIISNTEIFVQMLLDIAGLTSLFYFTGGASNPLVWFYLLPLMIAATILPRTYTWTMAGVTVACYSALFFFNVQLPHSGLHHDSGMHHDGGFQMHVLGMWVGFVVSAVFVAFIIAGLAHGLRERDRKLAEARERALQDERLVALGTLAAGAAHELGTPLGTMAILTAELEQEYSTPAHGDLQNKLGILHRQIDRCKEALSVLSASAGAGRAEAGHRMQVRSYLDEVVSEWQGQRADAVLKATIDTAAPPSEIIAERTLTQALINVLNNAADASPLNVTLEASWTADTLRLDVSDRGPGLDADMFSRLGRTPVSTKPEGMGVGLYLAQATIDRLGGRLSVRNRTHGGTTFEITLPLLRRD
jgi:two-component system sensor histidine kinase RegB